MHNELSPIQFVIEPIFAIRFLHITICGYFLKKDLFRQPFYPAGMLLRLLVVVDAHEEDVARVFRYLRRIVLPSNLVDGSVCRMVELQFDDEGRLGDVASGNQH